MRHLPRLVALSIIAVGGRSAVAQEQNISPELAREIAREACIWGYPLVLMDVTRQVLTNHEVASNELGLAPMNQFAHARTFPSTSFTPWFGRISTRFTQTPGWTCSAIMHGALTFPRFRPPIAPDGTRGATPPGSGQR